MTSKQKAQKEEDEADPIVKEFDNVIRAALDGAPVMAKAKLFRDKLIALESTPSSKATLEAVKAQIEDLARLEHQQWCEWSADLMGKENLSDERTKRWVAMQIPYDRLTEEQKEQDRVWARKVLKLLDAANPARRETE